MQINFKCQYQYGYIRNKNKKKCLITNRICSKTKDCPMRKLVYIANSLSEYLLDNQTHHIIDCLERIGKINYE